MPFLKSLNPTQAEAVTFGEGPLLILAGAGSGKTRVLTSRIAFLVMKLGIAPENILAVTFTNKAAGEMRERLQKLIGFEARNLWLGTFHSLGLRLLRKESKAAGIKTDLIVYGDDDQLSLVKQVMAELKLNEKSFAPRAILSKINQAKNENINHIDFAKYATDFLSERVAKVYSLYQKKLREMGCMDFGDLICEPINLLRQNPKLLEEYKEKFQYLLVDEYQDTNKAQYLFTNLLASGSRNLLAVGDPDQSIYAWRGADISNILDFEKDYPDATVLRLEQNYRSTKNILSAANSVIQRNMKRLDKTLWTDNHAGSTLTYEEARDEYDEARRVIKRLKNLLNTDNALTYKDFAVFYRTNAQSRVFEEQLMREGIPYVIIGGVRFYDRREIKDAIAYLRIISNPNDSISLQRIINTPPRGVGKTTFEKVQALSNQHSIPLMEAFKDALERGLLNKTRVKDFLEACESFRFDLSRLSLHELALRFLEDTGYMMMWQEEGTEEAMERVENLFEFISAIRNFEEANPGATLSDFLDQVALISDIDNYEEKLDRLTLMTLHSAKGLEFKAVFLVGMEEGLFPHSRSANEPEELEEERRLCYVGMTRAREELFLFSARSRNVYGESRYQLRSRFIDEIEPGLITILSTEERPKTVFTSDEPYYTAEGSQIEHTYHESHDPQPWRVGMKVLHPTFGAGIIKERSGTGEDTKVTINFQNHGIKKLIIKYASLTVLQ
ncbi:MAG: UvrD-helicase domain-containing protein [Deltaproteobacteria bacterium]|nr:UvrD-helicase domain-containing protein [Deltaproteobacteria bacterium]